ncbi:MAG: hypothetical protein ACP5I8_04565 [Phycisphaerae bacterium]
MSRNNNSLNSMNRVVNRKSISRRLLALAAAAVLAAGGWAGANLHAATTQTWAPGGVDASGNWDTTTNNWNPGQTTWTNTNVAAFGLGGSSSETVTIDTTGIAASGLTFNAMGSGASYTIAATGADALTLANSSGVNIIMNASATISAPVTFNNSVTLSGSGALTLSGDTSFVGTDSVQIGNGSTSSVPTLIVFGGGGTGNPSQIIFDSGTFKFANTGMGFNQPVISTDNGSAVTNTFDAGGAGLSQDIQSTITQSGADTFVLRDGTIYLTANNSTTFTKGTLQIGNGSLATNVLFGYQQVSGSTNENLPATGVGITLDGASLTQASTTGPNNETLDSVSFPITNSITLLGSGDAINAGTNSAVSPLTISGNLSGSAPLAINNDGSTENVILSGNNTGFSGVAVHGPDGRSEGVGRPARWLLTV